MIKIKKKKKSLPWLRSLTGEGGGGVSQGITI